VRERANAGEKRVLDSLARHLEDDYAVWHNIPIMGSGHEPDFVILHPQRGLLILEVKDWKRQTIAQANPILVELRTSSGLTNTKHPVSQRATADVSALRRRTAGSGARCGRHCGPDCPGARAWGHCGAFPDMAQPRHRTDCHRTGGCDVFAAQARPPRPVWTAERQAHDVA
jgi:hypothetical protein